MTACNERYDCPSTQHALACPWYVAESAFTFLVETSPVKPPVVRRDPDCQHRPVSPGQSVCACLDRQMWLELLVEGQARRIAELEAERQKGPCTTIFLDDKPLEGSQP